VTVALESAIREAEKAVYAEENRSDLYERRARIHALTTAGDSAAEISVITGLSRRRVEFNRQQPLPGPFPRAPLPRDVSDQRATELERTAHLVMGLAVRLRDENPVLVWDALSRLDRQRLQEVTVVALAGMNVEAPLSEVFGWVSEIGEKIE